VRRGPRAAAVGRTRAGQGGEAVDGAPAPGDPARALSRLFQEFADLLEVEGSEAHKAPAYRRAALGLRAFDGDLAAAAREGRLEAIPGIGRALARKVGEYLATGRVEALERLQAKVPAGVRALLEVRGVGPKLAAACWRRLGVTDLPGLAAACADGRLATLPGVGPARAARIREAIEAARAPEVLLAEAAHVAQHLAALWEGREGVAATHVAAQARRGTALVPGVHLVVAGEPEAVRGALGALGPTWREEAPGAAPAAPWRRLRLEGRLRSLGGLERELPVAVDVCPREALGTALLVATGSEAHLDELRAWRRQRGLPPEPPLAAEEEAVYAASGLPWIPPELREGRGEVRAAAEGRLLPPGGRLVEPRDLLGDLHCHTTWSDGRDDLAAMVAAARARGYRYLAVTDHSGSLVVAHGLDLERLRAQRAAIEALNAGAGDGFVVLQGAEVEVLRDGSLDYPDEALAALDFCVASLHNPYGQGAVELTARLLRALHHPAVDVIGHPTGRRLLRREAQPVDVARLAAEAAAAGKALEINGSPERLDLDADLARPAREAGVRFCLDSDAHAAGGLGDVGWAVTTARRAGIGPEAVINALPLAELRAWRARRRSPAGG
jgi:DNA polymerase (family 10)